MPPSCIKMSTRKSDYATPSRLVNHFGDFAIAAICIESLSVRVKNFAATSIAKLGKFQSQFKASYCEVSCSLSFLKHILMHTPFFRLSKRVDTSETQPESFFFKSPLTNRFNDYLSK